MPTPEFWSISFGNFLTIATIIGGGVAVVYTIRGRVDALSERMLAVERSMEQLVQVLIEQGRQEEQMKALREVVMAQGKRLDNLQERFVFWLNGRARLASDVPPDDRL